eukprot:GFUD01023237.1.p1 GENE.GFUD01023237.1~~GFUD01023237.1.p1  ORF type:complete len:381 (+),score=87.84 GFUD01023237.1:53-1195(+)
MNGELCDIDAEFVAIFEENFPHLIEECSVSYQKEQMSPYENLKKELELLQQKHLDLDGKYQSLLSKVDREITIKEYFENKCEEYICKLNNLSQTVEVAEVKVSQLKNMIEEQHKVRDDLEKENNKVMEDLEKEKNKGRRDLENKHTKVNEELNKYKSLLDKLRERIECPVCLELPDAGPVSVCPNGHLVCSKCTSYLCPTCRSRMFDGKSLLAVTVLENIDRKCLNEGCGEVSTFEKWRDHQQVCGYGLDGARRPQEPRGQGERNDGNVGTRPREQRMGQVNIRNQALRPQEWESRQEKWDGNDIGWSAFRRHQRERAMNRGKANHVQGAGAWHGPNEVEYWECSVCTFHNEDRYQTACTMCNSSTAKTELSESDRDWRW